MALRYDYSITIIGTDGFPHEQVVHEVSLVDALLTLYGIAGDVYVKALSLQQPTLLSLVKAPVTVPAAVSDLAEVAESATDTTLSYGHTAITNALWYEYEFTPTAGAALDDIVTDTYTTVTPITVTGLTAETAYKMRVRACNYAGASAWCTAVAATTAAAE